MSARIVVTEGPYRLTDAPSVTAQQGNSATGLTEADLSNALDGSGTAWLCRCGHSSIKPACSGDHETCGFDGGAAHTPLHTWPAGGASPLLTFVPRSSIEIENIDIELQDGTVIDMQGKATVLCRCGASTKKPGCDGTCYENGFDA